MLRAARICSSHALSAAILALALGTAPAEAASPAPADRAEPIVVGRYCTPLGCRGADGPALGDAVGFGAAALSLAILARRRRA